MRHPLSSTGVAVIFKRKITSVDKDKEKLEPSCFAGRNAKMHWMLVQTRGDSTISPNVYVNTESPYGSVGPVLG